MSNILFKDESFKIIGICMAIHNSLGLGLKEINYKDAMEIEFIENNIPCEREKRFEVMYKGKRLKHPYYADFFVYDSIIIEVKSCTALLDIHVTQVLSYLSVSNKKLGLLVNFGERSLSSKRVLL